MKKNFQRNYVLVFWPQNLFFQNFVPYEKTFKRNHVVLAMASKSFFEILFHMQKKSRIRFFFQKRIDFCMNNKFSFSYAEIQNSHISKWVIVPFFLNFPPNIFSTCLPPTHTKNHMYVAQVN